MSALNPLALRALQGSVVGIALAAALQIAPALAASNELIEAAKKEGTVTWYTGLVVNQGARPFAEAFEKKYGVKVEIVGGTVQDFYLKLRDEAKANAVKGDVSQNNATAILQLDQLGVIDKYTPDSAADYPATLRDPQGRFFAQTLNFLNPAINTDLVKEADVPKTWDDLLKPQFKGKMAWPASNLGGAIGFIGTRLLTMGDDKGMDYLKKLAGQQVVNLPANARVVLDQVIAGEYAVTLMSYSNHVAVSTEKGAHIRWLKLNPAMMLVDYGFITKGGPHPNAARLFMDYMLSVEGQQILAKAGYLPANPKVPALNADLKPNEGHFEAYEIPADAFDRDQDKWNKVFSDNFR